MECCPELIRRKDASDDYRFAPEPDLPSLMLNEKTFNGVSLEQFIQQNLPELASVAIQRLQKEYGVSAYQANVFEAADYSLSPRQVAANPGLELISDPVQLLSISRQVVSEHPEEVKVYRKGGKFVTKMQKLFTGKCMAACQGNAHPERLREAVEQALEEAASRK
jgi:Asp-tRNA(Asn)/Glu-tRNA(Gln) amidotransferase B subunit